MIHWDKVRAVTAFEFLSVVKRKAYIFATLGMPLFMLLWVGIPGLSSFLAHKKETETRVFGVVDPGGVLRLSGDAAAPLPELPAEARKLLESTGQADQVNRALAKGNAVFRPFATTKEAQRQVQEGTIRGYYLVTADYLETGRVEGYFRAGNPMGKDADGPFRNLLLDRLMTGRIPEDIAPRVKDPVAQRASYEIGPGGEVKEIKTSEEIAKVLVPLVLAMLLFISLMTSAGYLLQAVAVEKENRVVEVLLASANPDEILTGKLIGLGGAGLLQMLVWFGMAGVAGVFAASTLALAGFSMPWGAIGMGLVYFLSAYLFVGSLMLGLGSLGSTMRESQQISVFLTIPTVIPMMMLGALLTDPNGLVGQILTWIPFTIPLTMILRLAIEPAGVAWWEVGGSLVVMGASTWLAIKAGARLFRVGLLLTGARPKFKQVLRQAGLLRWS